MTRSPPPNIGDRLGSSESRRPGRRVPAREIHGPLKDLPEHLRTSETAALIGEAVEHRVPHARPDRLIGACHVLLRRPLQLRELLAKLQALAREEAVAQPPLELV